MLFNSYEFIFAFLPLSVLGFFLLERMGRRREAIAWLVVASLFFYGWWNPPYLALLVASIVFNFLVGSRLARRSVAPRRVDKALLLFGVAVNLAAIGYFKYANFFVGNVNALAGTDYNLGTIVLPLAISFFTFQQITFLVDSYRGETTEFSFLHYCLFVSFFPQLIAGPIVHHSEMLPQFRHHDAGRFSHTNLAVGLTIFAMGLFKKAVLADGVAVYATPVFNAAEAGQTLDFFTAWAAALAYTIQLYFDFSGYSDMAIGAARIFGITLPLNFNSPYKATSIIDFWRRWHMTLSRFLRDYVYISLGGNRHGPTRRHVNLMGTMLLGGLWHGAGWTFVVWGGLHGAYLVINHVWTRFRALRHGGVAPEHGPLGQALAWALTFVAVVVGLVFFRALTFDGALTILTGMTGLNGIELPAAIGLRLGGLGDLLTGLGIQFTPGGGARFVAAWSWIIALMAIVLMLPNTQQVMALYAPALDFHVGRSDTGHGPVMRRLRWHPTQVWSLLAAVILCTGLLALPEVTEFLYFQF
ncbi:MAG: MBOAT family protein [Rhodobacterales bacterium]|nr:MBOAT family protein [Rhodobacterales bacterium]